MDLTKYPTGADLIAYIESCSLTVPGGLTSVLDITTGYTGADARIQQVVDDFEEMTGWLPFLACKGDETLTFDAPGARQSPGSGYFFAYRPTGGGRILDVDCGLVSVSTVTAVSPTDGTPTVFVEGQDYILKPLNAIRKGQPYTMIEFLQSVLAGGNRIQVVGTVGYCTKLKAGVWQKLVQYGAYLTRPELSLGVSGGGLLKIQDITFAANGVSPLGPEANQWFDDYISMIENDYKRLTF